MNSNVFCDTKKLFDKHSEVWACNISQNELRNDISNIALSLHEKETRRNMYLLLRQMNSDSEKFIRLTGCTSQRELFKLPTRKEGDGVTHCVKKHLWYLL